VRSKDKKCDGFLVTELAVAMALLAVMLIAFAISLDVFKRFNNFQLEKQRCISAAQAQIESIAVTGKEIAIEDFERLWPKISFTIEKSNSTGQWEGLNLVEVSVKTKSFNREVKIRMSRYIEAKGN
jgi:hypothetical protein